MKTLHRNWLLACLLGSGATVSAPSGAAQALMVVTENTPNSYRQDGRVVGPATEVVEATLRRAGVADYRIDLYPWARAMDIALREPYVLIYLIARTPEREDRFRWVGEVKRIRYFLYSLPDRNDLRLNQVEDARVWTIGVVRDDVRQQYLQRRGFTRLAVSAQPMENLRKLLYRQVDLIALTESEARNLCEEARSECTGLTRMLPLDDLRNGLYMAYSLATPPELAARTSAAFETLRSDGSLARIMGPQLNATSTVGQPPPVAAPPAPSLLPNPRRPLN